MRAGVAAAEAGGALQFHGHSINSQLKSDDLGKTSLSGSITRSFGWTFFGWNPINQSPDQPLAAANGALQVSLNSELKVAANFVGTFVAWHSPNYSGTFGPRADLYSYSPGVHFDVVENFKLVSWARLDASWAINGEGLFSVIQDFKGVGNFPFRLW